MSWFLEQLFLFGSKTSTSAPLEKKIIKKTIANAMLEHSEKVGSFLHNGSN